MDPDTRDMDPDVIFPRKLLKKFILLYKDLPCLWDKQSPAYKHKQRRHEAISRLTMLVKEYDPTATRVHVLRKIESLRACIRREHKRVVDSRRFATHRDQIYVPHLWYYELFSFVFGEDANNTALKSDVRSPEQAAESIEEDEEEAPAHEDPPFERQDYVAEFSNVVEAVDSSSMAKRFPFEDDQSRSKRLCTEIGDEYDAIGVNVAAKLRALPPNMRILAEKLINDVLFQAQVNGLNSSTVISTTDPFKQDVM